MTRFAIISDLHFGTVPDGVARTLREDLQTQAPDLVVIAGDLTQRARTHQFEAAAAWLKSLALPWLCVPGNHDIPVHNPVERFHRPFRRYRKHVSEVLSPIWPEDPDGGLPAVFIGLNTVRSWQPHHRWQEGAVRTKSLRSAREALQARDTALRLVVSHHPLHTVPGNDRARVARNGARAGRVLAALGVNMLVSGHTHRSFVRPVSFLPEMPHLLSIGAPTAMSDRTRGEANGYWLVETDGGGRINLTLRSLRDTAYRPGATRSWTVGSASLDGEP